MNPQEELKEPMHGCLMHHEMPRLDSISRQDILYNSHKILLKNR
jgi:hypothetical protein